MTDDYAAMIARAARNLANMRPATTRAWRMGFSAGFRGQPCAANSPNGFQGTDADRAEYASGHRDGVGEREEFDSLDPAPPAMGSVHGGLAAQAWPRKSG